MSVRLRVTATGETGTVIANEPGGGCLLELGEIVQLRRCQVPARQET